ncbi:DUF1493 family protein [Salmonella enterica subsp. enterica]|nr:DUF1493 family protein [Salmonella enterica]ECG1483862.1 DUF1493 family protein [Salmonella enterica subsp. enterica]ECI6492971.1 DUF1493 family protein [Salmonella enterica subsp. enterica]EDP9633582.1 DUF1493 family protein [Salmonella enterica subsp. enterica]EDT2838284.1 DUF1493 family protein [Salmonella enterica subsp. enterica]
MLMHSPDKNIISSLSPLTLRFLREARFSEKDIVTFTETSTLLKDLELYGEMAEDVINILPNRFGVDMSTFIFSKYFPCEQSEDTNHLDNLFLLKSFKKIKLFDGFIKKYEKKAEIVYSKYTPITLSMIALTLEQKKWLGNEHSNTPAGSLRASI